IDDEKLLGMKFNSLEDAYKFYNSYAKRHGFGVRKFRSRKKKDDIVYRKQFCCNKQGFKSKVGKERSYTKLETRTEIPDSSVDSGTAYMRRWAQSLSLVQPTIRRQTVSQRELFRYSRICFAPWFVDRGAKWESILPYAEFAYNNSYHSSIQMAPYEALYGRKCRSPLYWDDVGERQVLGPKMIEETAEQVELIRQRLKTAQSRQKSSADHHRRDIQFEIGEPAFLRVHPIRGVVRFGKRGKLHPRFIGPFEVLERVGEVAYPLHEDNDSFQWLLDEFLKSMGGKQPSTIMIEEDAAMAAVIPLVLTQSQHHLCTWHIDENSKKHIQYFRIMPDFINLFHLVLRSTDTIPEFNFYWK
ncbi:Unknown protein, partial [Striga hermonthica]